MNKQRKVLITTTYNEMGVIIDTKAEEVAQPNLQSTCNQLATDCISRQAAIDAINSHFGFNIEEEYGSAVQEVINSLPAAQSEQWIPCSERPKRTDRYLVTYLADGKYSLIIDDYYPELGWAKTAAHTIAWMPLPAPYKED